MTFTKGEIRFLSYVESNSFKGRVGDKLLISDKIACKDFQKLITKLKEFREKAEYENTPVTQDDGQDAFQQGCSIINILNRNFK